MSANDLNDLYWHDGNINSLSYEIGGAGSAAVILSVSLYTNDQSQEREPLEITCLGVGDVGLKLSTEELKQNMFAGNISNAYLKRKTLWIYFTDGIFEVTAKKFEVKKC